VALQVVAPVEDHVTADALPNCTAAGFATIAMAGAGTGADGGVSSPPLWQPDIAASAPIVQIVAARFTIDIGTIPFSRARSERSAQRFSARSSGSRKEVSCVT